MLPPAFNRPPLARGWCGSSATSSRPIVAETRAQALDAAEAVIIEYDPLPVVVDPEAALAEDAPVVFPDHGSNLAIAFEFGSDPTIFDDADLVVEGRFVNRRVAPVPMEPNGVLVEPGSERRDHGDGPHPRSPSACAILSPVRSASIPRSCGW